jgi:hypothetical protein
MRDFLLAVVMGLGIGLLVVLAQIGLIAVALGIGLLAG